MTEFQAVMYIFGIIGTGAAIGQLTTLWLKRMDRKTLKEFRAAAGLDKYAL